MLGRCFNCLEQGHWKWQCREPTRCLRCGRGGHRSFECRKPRLSPHRSQFSRSSYTSNGTPTANPSRQEWVREHPGSLVPRQEAPANPPRPRHRNRRRRGCRGGGRRQRRAGNTSDGVPSERMPSSATPFTPPLHRLDTEARLQNLVSLSAHLTWNNGKLSMNIWPSCSRSSIHDRR